MKKIIGGIAMLAIAASFFLNSNAIGDSENIDLASLTTLNSANAEDVDCDSDGQIYNVYYTPNGVDCYSGGAWFCCYRV